MHDATIKEGISNSMVTEETAKGMYASTIDHQWLRDYLRCSTFDIWSE